MNFHDPKIGAILDAAFAVFAHHGFRKTSMLDIAEAAGMSRAALYLHFKNKEDVFRCASQRLHDEVMADVVAAMAADGPAMARIVAALSTFFAGLLGPVQTSVYGRELFDANMALAGDITLAARGRIQALIADALQHAHAQGEIDLDASQASADALAELILTAADGFKHAQPAPRLDALLPLLMRLIGKAVQPRPAS
jgi:AcrR family transcriptional regulator